MFGRVALGKIRSDSFERLMWKHFLSIDVAVKGKKKKKKKIVNVKFNGQNFDILRA